MLLLKNQTLGLNEKPGSRAKAIKIEKGKREVQLRRERKGQLNW